jgi:hypothetical protein
MVILYQYAKKLKEKVGATGRRPIFAPTFFLYSPAILPITLPTDFIHA